MRPHRLSAALASALVTAPRAVPLLAIAALLGAGCAGSAEEVAEPVARVGTAGGESGSSRVGPLLRGASRTVAGQLSASDPRYEDGYHDRYTISVLAGDRLRVRMWSLDFDTFLVLLGPNGEPVTTDDDGSGTLDAYFEHPVETAGAYTIVATSYSGETTGSYALHVHAAPELPDPVNLERGEIEEGYEGEGGGEIVPSDPPVVDQRFTEVFSPGGPTTSRGAAFRAYPVFAQAGDTLHVMMRSADFDTYLHLLDPSGMEVGASDDDATAGGLNSYVVYQATVSGQYTVQASSYSPEGSGTYELLIGRAPGGP